MSDDVSTPGSAEWREELVRWGGSIRQDDEPDASEEVEALEQAGIDRYLSMLDAVEGTGDADVVEAVMWSLHPLDDYGIYEAAYGVLSTVPAELVGAVGARIAPRWIARNGHHHTVSTGLVVIAYNDDARAAFVAGAAEWSAADRAAVIEAVTAWARDDEGWDDVLVALGGAKPATALEPIPDEWPDDWRAAAEGFRESGRVDLAWANERDLPANFPRVFALIELQHGGRWREVADFLNIFMRRRAEFPGFAVALGELPDARRHSILAAIERADPARAEQLRSLLSA